MRILFNHGLTASELYSNTPTKVTDKHWRWFIKYYGHTNSYSDALADPFKYCLHLVFNKIIDEKVRFKIPCVAQAYIDFEIVSGDQFQVHCQNGRFQNIDFISSDFTGYAIRYYYMAKTYQKSYQIFLGSKLKEKFINKINSGEKFYTTKDFELKDIIHLVQDRFKELSKAEVKKLLNHGFRRMHYAIKFGCAITIATEKFGDCYIYIGALSLNPEKQIKAYVIRRDRKLRKIEGWKKTPFDGNYYVALNPKNFQIWLDENRKARTIITFRNVAFRKIQKEVYYRGRTSHVFKIKQKKFRGWSFWSEKLTTRDVEYIGDVDNLSFTPTNKTWKELIKEYETRGSQQL